jgi:hypothetical protein
MLAVSPPVVCLVVYKPPRSAVVLASGIAPEAGIVGLASAERISVYSASGAIPLASTTAERGGLYSHSQWTANAPSDTGGGTVISTV